MEFAGLAVNDCPYKVIGKDLRACRTALDVAAFVDKGAGWPAPGGWADQTAACVEAVKCAWRARQEIRERIESGKGPL